MQTSSKPPRAVPRDRGALASRWGERSQEEQVLKNNFKPNIQLLDYLFGRRPCWVI